MSQSWSCRILVLAVLSWAGGPRPAPAATAPPSKAALRVRVAAGAGMAVKRALLAAKLRLGASQCQQVFSEFRSSRVDRPLSEVLEQLGRTPAEHLDTLTFEDGSRRDRCTSSANLAFTWPGRDRVYVCPTQFLRAVRNDPVYAEMILIHELLHTLGLGENPPTSLEITARVTERCGRAPLRRADAPR